MNLLEREDILRDLLGHLDEAAQGQGRLVLLGGGAGVGKTAVIRRLGQLAGPQTRVMVGACDPMTTPCPLGPLADVTALLGGVVEQTLTQVLSGAGSISAVFRGLLAELSRDGQVTLLVFEDVHWADEATLDLLRYLGKRIDTAPVVLVATYRDDEIGWDHPLAVLRGDLAACPAVERHSLAPLSQAAVARLATGHDLDPDELYRTTGGNPFFVSEILTAGCDGIPATVRDAMLGRVARLTSSARAVVEAVTIIGFRTTLGLLARTLERHAETELEEALAAGVLCADGRTIGFRHELARMAVLDAIPDYRRVAWHGRVLTALRSRPLDPEDLARLAHHAEEAGDEPAVLEYAPRAAAHAAALGAHREAAAQYTRSLRYAAALPPAQRAALLEGRAHGCYLTSRIPEAIDSWREALELRRAHGDRLREGDDLRWLSYMYWQVGRNSEAMRTGLQALHVLGALEPSRELAWAYVNLTQLSSFDCDLAAAVTYADQAISLGTRLDEPAVILRARAQVAMAKVMCLDEGWEELEDAWRSAMENDLEVHAGFAGVHASWVAVLHHDLRRADRFLAQTMGYCLDHDLMTYLLFAHGVSACAMSHHGLWTEAAETANAVLGHPDLSPVSRALPLVALALTRARCGDPEVWPLLDEAVELVEPTELIVLGAVWEARAEVAWLAGDDAKAIAEAARGLKTVTEHSAPWLAGGLVRWIHLAGGQAPDVPVDKVCGFEIAGAWEAAARYWERLDCPYDAALARLAGDASALEHALATFELLGAQPAAARTRARMRALGLRRTVHGPHAATRGNPYGLTNRQLEILRLLEEGLSDAEIAARLSITPKTVGHHVSAILTKLGVRSRHQAVRGRASTQLPPIHG